MDVVCGRCRAEYEFDNALISERGTTVRCTSCGLQFKIFPPLGQRAVELWRVFRAEHLDQPVLEYASLEELQRGIAAATVRRTDWLARGDDAARPLAEILELQPLLGQRNSERPPAVQEIGADVPTAKAVLRLGSSGTVIGMPPTDEEDLSLSALAPPAPLVPEVEEAPDSTRTIVDGAAVLVDDISSDANNALVEKWVEPAVAEDDTTVVVPSLPPEDAAHDALSEHALRSSEVLVPAAGSGESLAQVPLAHGDRDAAPRRKVRSALSHGSTANSGAAVRPQRASLLARTRIGGSYPVESEPPSSGRRAASYPPPLPDRAPDSPKAAPAAADQASAVPALEQVPAGRRMEARPAAPAPKKPSEVGIPEELAIPVTSSHVLYQPNDRDGGQAGTARGRAPQASAGRRRSSSPGREEMASSPGAPPRKATFSVVLVLVFATAGGFLVWSQIKSPQLTGRTESASQTPIASAQRPANQLSSSEQLRTRLVELESAWWLQLLKEQPTATLGEPVWTELSPLLTPGPNWERVNVLRLAGKLKEAREVAMQLPTTGADYALATLDLIETDHPPWELLSRRFKDAAVGETAPFLARTGFIFSLAKQGSSLAARTEYENLSKMQGASHSSLYSELGAFLRRTEQTPRPELGAEQETASAASALATAAPTPAPVAAVVTPPPVVLTAPAPAVPAEKTPQAEEVKKKKDVPEAVKAKVDQADQLWRSGDRDGAVVLYRQVVAEIGTSHFLGQRSAARVAQAAREAASGEPQ